MKKYSYFPITPFYYPFALELANKYKNLIFDDYSEFNIIHDIRELKPHFYIVLYEKEPMGVIYLSNWVGNSNKYHKCDIHAFADKKFFGKQIREVGKLFINDVFKKFSLYRMQSQVTSNNLLTCKLLKDLGFKEEGILRNASLIKGKLYNDILFGITKEELNNGK